MDASSIITQVSRDDELGAFNNEKGAYRVNRPAPSPSPPPSPLPPFAVRGVLRQMLPRFRSLAPVTVPRTPVFSPRSTSPNFILRLSFPVSYASNFSRVFRALAPAPPLYTTSVMPSHLNPSSLRLLGAMSRISLFFYVMSCPLTFHTPFTRCSLRAGCEDGKNSLVKG